LARGFVPVIAASFFIKDERDLRRYQLRQLSLTPSSVTFAEVGFVLTAFARGLVAQKTEAPTLFVIFWVELLLFTLALQAGDNALVDGEIVRRWTLTRSFALAVAAVALAAASVG
jgi:hypothetical protein